MHQKYKLQHCWGALNITNWMDFALHTGKLNLSSDCSLAQLILPIFLSPVHPPCSPPFSTSPPYPSRGVQLLPGHAVVVGAWRAVRRCGFLRRGLWERTGVGARGCVVCCQSVLQTAAPGAQEQVGEILSLFAGWSLTSCFPT